MSDEARLIRNLQYRVDQLEEKVEAIEKYIDQLKDKEENDETAD